MPRLYKRKLGSGRYQDYTAEKLQAAIEDVQNGMSYRQAGEAHGIPFRTLKNKIDKKHTKRAGGQTIFSKEEELQLVQSLKVCAEWGQPITAIEIRMIAKRMLSLQGRVIKQFPNNIPGCDWVASFISRHKADITLRSAANIKRSRADKTKCEITNYFHNLELSLKDIPNTCIINYDETNLGDDPGKKKFIFKRGCKYPENIMNYTKGSTSIMFAGTATGYVFPPYVVYKAEHMWDSWCENGPANARYNRSRSGWFDSQCFHDWFNTIILPYCKKFDGPKVLIGDNLSSHIHTDIIEKCSQHDIRFVFLPPNSTHLTQPLDVTFFRPLKTYWRQILHDYQIKNPRIGTIPKETFPQLLKQLCLRIGMINNKILVKGFETCGIFPFDPQKILRKLPDSDENTTAASQTVSQALLSHLQETRHPEKECAKKRKKRVNIEAGKSVSAQDLLAVDSEPGTSKSKKNKQVSNDVLEEDNMPSDDNSESESNDIEFDNNLESESAMRKKGPTELKVADWVIVEYVGKKQSKKFVGQIIQKKDNFDYLVKFMKQKDKHCFFWPDTEDISDVDYDMIVGVIKEPEIGRRGFLYFEEDI